MFKCSIGREDLLKPLGQISGVAGGSSGGSSQQPSITTNVLLEIKPVENPVVDGPKYKLCMICTDNEIQMSTEAGLFCDDVSVGKITVNVKILLEILKKLPDGAYVTLAETKNEKMLLSSGKFDSNMATMDADLFPCIETTGVLYELKINAKVLLNIMKTTKFSIAAESYRFFLRGMRFSVTGTDNMGLDIITADGHRMSMQYGSLVEPCNIPDSVDDNGFIFPKKGVDQLVSMLSNMDNDEGADSVVTLKISKNSLQTQVNGISLLSVLIEAKYPDISTVLPSNCSRILILDRKQFHNTINRVSIMSNSLNKAVELVLKDNVFTIKTKNSNHEEAKDDMDYISYEGDNFEMAFNSDYLNQICNVINTSKIKISMSKTSNNLLIQPLADEGEEESFARYIVSRVVI